MFNEYLAAVGCGEKKFRDIWNSIRKNEFVDPKRKVQPVRSVSCAKAIITGNPPVPTSLCCDVLWPAEMYGGLVVTKGCYPFRATNSTTSAFDKLLLCSPPHLFIFK